MTGALNLTQHRFLFAQAENVARPGIDPVVEWGVGDERLAVGRDHFLELGLPGQATSACRQNNPRSVRA